MLWWTVATAELRRGWLIKRRYPLDLIFSMAGSIVFLVTVAAGAMMVMGGRIALDPAWAPRIWGLVLSGLAGSALSGGIGYINQHTYTGTLEQIALSPVSLPGLVVLRQVTSLLVGLPYLLLYGVGLWWFFPAFGRPADMALAVLVVYFGMMGLGLVIAGLAVIFKQVQSVLGFMVMALYPVPLLVTADHLATRLWSLLPYGLGLQITMGAPVEPWVYLMVPAAWVLFGFLFLRWADGAARRKGVLGLY